MIPTLRPRTELLSRPLLDKIVEEAFLLLERKGVFVENTEALALFREADQPVEQSSGRVRIGRRLIESSLAGTPATITMYDRSGEKAYVVGGDEVHFDPGSAAVRFLDASDWSERKAETRDVVDLIRVAEACPNLHFQSTALISTDVPEILADSYRVLVGLLYSTKPVVTGTFRVEGFRPMLEMLAAVRGGTEELRRKPLAIFDACPSPPLKWSRLTAQSLIDAARAGIPSELISMGLTGATSPVTIAGTLVQHVAENLAGLVVCQLARSGAPVIFGGSPASFDMRRGTTPMGAMETMMIDMAYAQIGKALRLPTHAYMALSDSKIIDSQAGFETGMGAVLAALAGINVVSGPGMLDFESAQSPEKLVIDDEICGMAYRLVEGIAQREEPLALHLFESFGPESEFLTLSHTRTWYRKEHLFPRLADRNTHEAWAAEGRKSQADRARERVAEILAKTPPALPEDGLAAELRRIMSADASRNGVERLPPMETL
jgi:trimethylamine---corrinoid protein Co-methyltransferase